MTPLRETANWLMRAQYVHYNCAAAFLQILGTDRDGRGSGERNPSISRT
jgi:hypothetical protein